MEDYVENILDDDIQEINSESSTEIVNHDAQDASIVSTEIGNNNDTNCISSENANESNAVNGDEVSSNKSQETNESNGSEKDTNHDGSENVSEENSEETTTIVKKECDCHPGYRPSFLGSGWDCTCYGGCLCNFYEPKSANDSDCVYCGHHVGDHRRR